MYGYKLLWIIEAISEFTVKKKRKKGNREVFSLAWAVLFIFSASLIVKPKFILHVIGWWRAARSSQRGGPLNIPRCLCPCRELHKRNIITISVKLTFFNELIFNYGKTFNSPPYNFAIVESREQSWLDSVHLDLKTAFEDQNFGMTSRKSYIYRKRNLLSKS